VPNAVLPDLSTTVLHSYASFRYVSCRSPQLDESIDRSYICCKGSVVFLPQIIPLRAHEAHRFSTLDPVDELSDRQSTSDD
jgi:hypothetical protein